MNIKDRDVEKCFEEKMHNRDFSQCSITCLLNNNSCLRNLATKVGEELCGQCLINMESKLEELNVDESIMGNLTFLGEVEEVTFLCDECGWWCESQECNLYLKDQLCNECFTSIGGD